MSKVPQEKGYGNLPSSTETNPRDHVKSISTTADADTTPIRRIGPGRYAVSGSQNSKMFFVPSQTTIPFPSRLYDDWYDEEEGSYGLKDLDAYSIGTTLLDDALPPKEKYQGLRELAPTKLIVELADRIVKRPKDFAVMKNMDAYRNEGIGDIIVGRPFCKEACINSRRFDGMITIYDGNDSVTYQMARSHPRFKHLTNAQCNKMRPLRKVSAHDELKGI
nr:hypothetical protein [Tanacetum cinerariifolium]